MDEYINKQQLLKKAKEHQDNVFGIPLIIAEIENAETTEIKHGEWILHYDELTPADSTIECSVCHEEERMSMHHKRYCPNCGAIMDESKI